MDKEWISGREGRNLKFKREALLNYALNRWALNKAHSVGPTSELIRKCAPKRFEQWDTFYFNNATQRKRNGVKVTREYITDLGRRLYVKLSEVVQNELESIEEQECIDYVYNLVLNRTYEGYRAEVDTVYGQLESRLEVKIHPAPDEWDRTYNVDFYIQVGDKYIGLQIKPISSGLALDQYQWDKMHEVNHKKFEKKFGGKVFFVYSVKSGKKKEIYNTEVIEEIKNEIKRLQN
ncbi:MAG TPA: MjaI family restriction endonuclease [Sedimentisphaerales bacterium]|nr:MjaI family restriction endonuclease [Sedimentisphaerales bacterium]